MTYKHKVAGMKRTGSYLLSRNVAPAKLLQALEMPTHLLLAEHTWLDRRSSLLLSLETARSTGDPLAGLQIAERTPFSDYGVWGDGIVSARRLQGALTFACREVHRVETGTRLQLHEEGPYAHLSLELRGPLELDPRQHRERSLLMLRRMLDLAVEHVPATVYLPHERVHGADPEPWFGTDVNFHSDRTALVFDRSALELSLRAPPPVPARCTADDTARKVMRTLDEILAFDRPTAQAVASALRINVRTMQRHLAAWGVTFEELLDQYRRHLALQHLESGELSITDIAFRLGYSDSAHFTRAFRRWTGKCPRQMLNDFSAARRREPVTEAA